MDQQQQGGNGNDASGDDASSTQRPLDERAMNDSTWGTGAASAMENLRRHNFRGRRSKEADDERPGSD